VTVLDGKPAQWPHWLLCGCLLSRKDRTVWSRHPGEHVGCSRPRTSEITEAAGNRAMREDKLETRRAMPRPRARGSCIDTVRIGRYRFYRCFGASAIVDLGRLSMLAWKRWRRNGRHRRLLVALLRRSVSGPRLRGRERRRAAVQRPGEGPGGGLSGNCWLRGLGQTDGRLGGSGSVGRRALPRLSASGASGSTWFSKGEWAKCRTNITKSMGKKAL
jgi:hypothetical protein